MKLHALIAAAQYRSGVDRKGDPVYDAVPDNELESRVKAGTCTLWLKRDVTMQTAKAAAVALTKKADNMVWDAVESDSGSISLRASRDFSGTVLADIELE